MFYEEKTIFVRQQDTIADKKSAKSDSFVTI